MYVVMWRMDFGGWAHQTHDSTMFPFKYVCAEYVRKQCCTVFFHWRVSLLLQHARTHPFAAIRSVNQHCRSITWSGGRLPVYCPSL